MMRVERLSTRGPMQELPMVTGTRHALRVLVVEDELLIRWSIAQTLTDAGHAVLEAADGAAAILALSGPRSPVDAVLLDFRLPDSNDLTLLARIRQLTPRSSVIMMTAYGTPEVIQAALDLGADRVIIKPFEMHELSDMLTESCGPRPAAPRRG
jgi:DNA-binding response OmpR family regulator